VPSYDTYLRLATTSFIPRTGIKKPKFYASNLPGGKNSAKNIRTAPGGRPLIHSCPAIRAHTLSTIFILNQLLLCQGESLDSNVPFNFLK
jgi:hypothetical protein